MKLILRPYVEKEIEDAAEWYQARRSDLREAFLDEVIAALGRIDENPYLYATIHRKIRRAPLKRFPYGIYYALIAGSLHVLAVVHDARHPSVWKRRK